MREIDNILNENEEILWEGTPKFWPFCLDLVYFSLAGLFFFFVYLFFFPFIPEFGQLTMGMFFVFIMIVTVILPIYRALIYKHIYYVITDKRVIIQTGLVGRDFHIIDFDQITNAEVNVGVTDKLLGKGSGSIRIFTPSSVRYTSDEGATSRPYTLSHIQNPYEVFKFFKKVYFDVKTDMKYPNLFRPDTNPGYQTKYEPKKIDQSWKEKNNKDKKK